MFILLVKTWNFKKIRGMNNIKDLEMILDYEIHPRLRHRYFPGETDKSLQDTVVTVSITAEFRSRSLPKNKSETLQTAPTRSIFNQLVKQDWSRRRTCMEWTHSQSLAAHRVARCIMCVTQHISLHWNRLKQ